jgi:aminopeptidase N
VEPGVSRELARARAARISEVRYGLHFELKLHGETTAAHEVLQFTDSGSGDLPVDFRDGSIAAAKLNGKTIATSLENGHLVLPAAALAHGANKLEVDFTANIGAAGKAITRYEDKDDGSEYVYTLFVPMDASMAFPCFDQPDLKARFTLQVVAPAEWSVIGNTAPQLLAGSGPTAQTSFAETRPISTYLFAFAAGPFARIDAAAVGQPAMYVRRSQLARARTEAPQVQGMTARGVQYLSNYFAQPFPFPKYDLVLIPGFPFGGMEHAGATFLNEDGVLFRTAPTQSDYFRRNTLVLHETCHQWFGDLVTMQWFDDLWLKEGFAQYMAYKALAVLEPKSEPWKHFYEDIKPLAYGIDETQGTTPIFQVIPNLKDAKSAYGAIVYQKAPAVLKQLNYRLGDVTFRDGLRLYLKQHAYSNAQWADLIGAFEASGGKDVKGWADAWILRRGMPQVEAEWTCARGRVKTFALRQHDVLNTEALWPIDTEILFDSGYPSPVIPRESSHGDDATVLRTSFSTARQDIPSAIGKSCPALVFANYEDQAYGRFLLDDVSSEAVDRHAPPADQPLLKSMLWGALWDEVHVALMPPDHYVALALEDLATEQDEAQSRVQGARVVYALHHYLSARAEQKLAAQAEDVFGHNMLSAGTLGLRIVNFRSFTAAVQTSQGEKELHRLLEKPDEIRDMPLTRLDRWNVLGRLVSLDEPAAGALLAAELAKDQSGEAKKYSYAAMAGAPDPAVKQRYFADYLKTDGGVQEDWLTQSLRPFNSWNQSALTLPYLAQALDALPEVKAHRKIFFLGAWLGAFMDGQNSPEAQKVVQAWLARTDIDPDLRLKVLETSDALDRAVAIRQRFPE